MSRDQMERLIKNMDYHIKERQIYECDFQEMNHPIYYHHPEFGKIYITGRMDCLDRDYVWEFKCVKEFTLEHFLQVICYHWLWNLCLKSKFSERTFRLLNIRTGEMYEMRKDDQLIQDVMNLLILNRYEKMISISDEEFVKICLDTKNKL